VFAGEMTITHCGGKFSVLLEQNQTLGVIGIAQDGAEALHIAQAAKIWSS